MKKIKGQSLIEVLLAVAVSIIVIPALISLAVLAMRISQSALIRSQAQKLAQGGIESVRIQRDSDPSFYGVSVSADRYLMISNGVLSSCEVPTCNSASAYCSPSDFGNYFDTIVSDDGKTKLCRKIKLGLEETTSGLKFRKVLVEVKWKEGSGDRVSLISGRIYEK